MIDVEVFGEQLLPSALSPAEVTRGCARAQPRVWASRTVTWRWSSSRRSGSPSSTREHRARPEPTDVLSFPIDGVEPRAEGAPP